MLVLCYFRLKWIMGHWCVGLPIRSAGKKNPVFIISFLLEDLSLLVTVPFWIRRTLHYTSRARQGLMEVCLNHFQCRYNQNISIINLGSIIEFPIYLNKADSWTVSYFIGEGFYNTFYGCKHNKHEKGCLYCHWFSTRNRLYYCYWFF